MQNNACRLCQCACSARLADAAALENVMSHEDCRISLLRLYNIWACRDCCIIWQAVHFVGLLVTVVIRIVNLYIVHSYGHIYRTHNTQACHVLYASPKWLHMPVYMH